jgi:ankyrin repeat protein
VVKVLLENGANVNALDDDGLTPLMDCNWMDTVKVLLEHGANPWLRDKKGKNALERAVADQEKEKVALLHGLEPATPSEKQ